MYSYHNNILPRSFDDTFSWKTDIHNHFTRNGDLYYVPFSRTNIRQFTVNYQGPKFFNSLSHDIRDALTVSCFQFKLKNYLLYNM